MNFIFNKHFTARMASKKTKTSLTEKLILYFVSFGILAIIIVISYSYSKTRRVLIDRAYDQLTSVRVEKKKQLERFFNDRIQETALLSKTDDVIKLIEIISRNKTINSNCESQIKKLIQYEFNQYFDKNHYFSQIILLDKELKGILVTFNYEAHTFQYETCKNKQTEIDFSRVKTIDLRTVKDSSFFNFENKGVISFVQSVSQENKHIGYIVPTLSKSTIDEIMLEKSAVNGLGESGESYLIGHDYHFRSSSRFEAYNASNVKAETKSVVRALNGETGTDITSDYRGINVLSSFSNVNLRDLNWVILAEIDYKEILAPVISISSETIFLTIFVSIAVLIFAYFFSSKLIAKVNKINLAAQNVGNGNFNIKLDLNSNDELGALADSFNLMAQKLCHQNKELEKERQAKLFSIIEGQEKERQRLSRELHDGIAQEIIAVKLKLESYLLRQQIQDETVKNIRNGFDHIIQEIRRMSNNLMPVVLEKYGLEKAANELCSACNQLSATTFIFESNGSIEIDNAQIRLHLFRIIQESTSNILKYAEAKTAYVYIEKENEELKIIIKDNGVGFQHDNQHQFSGQGLFNIQERANLIGAELSIRSRKSTGTRIELKLSLKKA